VREARCERERLHLKGWVRSVTTARNRGETVFDVLSFDKAGRVIPLNIAVDSATLMQPTPEGRFVHRQVVAGADFWSMDALHGVGFSTCGADVAQTNYNADRLAQETLLLDSSGRVISRVTYRCDASGAIREAIQPADDEVLSSIRQAPAGSGSARGSLSPEDIKWRVSFDYDSAGRLTAVRGYLGVQLVKDEVRTYNEHGDLLTTMSEDGLVQYEYEYDHWGNWIRRIARSADSVLVVGDEVRVITYYGE
jgi:hypothetical protein